MRAVRSIRIDAPTAQVFGYLTEASRHPEWAGNPLTICLTSSAPLRVGSTWKSTGRRLGTHVDRVTVVELDPECRIANEADGDAGRWRSRRRMLTTAVVAGLLAVPMLGTPAAAYPVPPAYEDNRVVSLGGNSQGELGDNTTVSRDVPVRALGLPRDVRKVVTGFLHTVALDVAGNLWAWGYNPDGRLGDGTTTTRLAPVRIHGLTNVTQVAVGSRHSIALRSDGTVWAWGANERGQLGDRTTVGRSAPTQAPGITTAVAVAGGESHSIALLADGTVLAWGHNASGQLGDGTRVDRLTPVPVVRIGTAVKISAGGDNNSAILADGRLARWGSNLFGQLGIGNVYPYLIPVYLPSLTNVVQVADSGSGSAYALTSDGKLWCWGNNDHDEYGATLGDGTYTSHKTPVQSTGAPTGITHLAAGKYGGLVVTDTGRVWVWGFGNRLPTIVPGIHGAFHGGYNGSRVSAVVKVPLGIG